MIVKFFDGYDLQSLNLNSDFTMTWVSVPVIRKRLEIKYITKELYDFLDIPAWEDINPSGNVNFEKGIALFLMLSDRDNAIFIRSSNGLYYERDRVLSQKLTMMLEDAAASGDDSAIINLNNGDFGDDDPLELIPKQQSMTILQILEAFQDTVFA